MERKCASELPSPCRNFTSGISARNALVRSAGTSGSAFSLTEMAHVVCGVMIVQIPSPSVKSASARCTSSVMTTICSRALVRTVKVLSRMWCRPSPRPSPRERGEGGAQRRVRGYAATALRCGSSAST